MRIDEQKGISTNGDATKTRFWPPNGRPRPEKSLPLWALWSFSHVIFKHISRIISSSCKKGVLVSGKNKSTVRIWGSEKSIHIRAFLYILIIYSNMVTRKSDFNIGQLENSSDGRLPLYTTFFDILCLLQNGLKALIQSYSSLTRTIKMDHLKHYYCLNFHQLKRNMS
jgi:hypothetical protein